MSETCIAVPFEPLPIDKFEHIVESCQQHRPWFPDALWNDARARREAVIAYLADAYKNGKLWEVWRAEAVVGILLLNEMQPGLDARCHMVFFDAKLSDKAQLCRNLMASVYETVPLEVLRVELPTYAAALLKFLRKQLGFKFENERSMAATAATASRKYRATLYKGSWMDAILLSQTRDEFVAFCKDATHGWRKSHTT